MGPGFLAVIQRWPLFSWVAVKRGSTVFHIFSLMFKLLYYLCREGPNQETD